MRDDLLHAQASIDWAVSNFPTFEKRLNTWVEGHFDIIIKESDSGASHNSLIAIEKEPLPFTFNVEAGAYINAIRSSLDILATALAYRYEMPCRIKTKAYFPVAKDASEFISGRGYKGSEFVNGLPPYRTSNHRISETLSWKRWQ
jgi:hypothetical protein